MRKSTAKPTLPKGGKKTTTAPTSKDEKSSGVALNATDLGYVIGDLMNRGSTNLTNLLVSHSDGHGAESSGDDCDSSVPKDDGESLVEEEPSASKKKERAE
ncbi:hypothetical protein P5673_009947 [Acropora cervicornis]|uniref:Uncharacterized protein n=1 Tax=Acropora cervicornis TaxID=6130 RepID=A0AAD9VA08_ACRCE|nr:hypothetical protein P5673_009947 [Acropora cervicornis]